MHSVCWWLLWCCLCKVLLSFFCISFVEAVICLQSVFLPLDWLRENVIPFSYVTCWLFVTRNWMYMILKSLSLTIQNMRQMLHHAVERQKTMLLLLMTKKSSLSAQAVRMNGDHDAELDELLLWKSIVFFVNEFILLLVLFCLQCYKHYWLGFKKVDCQIIGVLNNSKKSDTMKWCIAVWCNYQCIRHCMLTVILTAVTSFEGLLEFICCIVNC